MNCTWNPRTSARYRSCCLGRTALICTAAGLDSDFMSPSAVGEAPVKVAIF